MVLGGPSQHGGGPTGDQIDPKRNVPFTPLHLLLHSPIAPTTLLYPSARERHHPELL